MIALADLDAIILALEEDERVLRARLKAIREKRAGKMDDSKKRSTRVDGDKMAKISYWDEPETSDEEWVYDGYEGADEAQHTENTRPNDLYSLQHEARAKHLHLPDEIIIQIVNYLAQGHPAQRAVTQQALATCCLLSRSWYEAAIASLYRHPYLYGRNFDPFLHAICPSINLHVRKSPLANLVRILDMSKLVHQGSNRTTARLLGRTKGNLEEFIAPQASFAINCFAALSKCVKLRTLDLSLVSEAPPLPDLFNAISHLENLRALRLPRSTGFGVHHKSSAFTSCWPPNLISLTLSGGIDAHFLHGVASFPSTLRDLTIEHCPLAKSHAVTHLLRNAVKPLKNLESLKIAHMPRLSSHALDGVLFLLPQISSLSVSVDYVTPALFDDGHFHHPKDPDEPPPFQHLNLRKLELTNSGQSSYNEDKLSPVDVIIAVHDATLPSLRQVRVAQSLGWHGAGVGAETEALSDALQEGAKRDWESREWIFKDLEDDQYRRDACWERVSGVWVFEG